MKKGLKLIFVCALILSLLSSSIGCSASKDSANMEASYNQATTNDSAQSSFGGSERGASPEVDEDSRAFSEDSGFQVTQDILGDRKIIFNAYMILEVEDFDARFRLIQSMVENSGIGYLQNSTSRSHRISAKPERYRKEGTIVLRVAQSKFYNVLNEIQDLGEVRENRINTEEITDQYYDTKHRTQIREAERERIMVYLQEAPDLNTMLQLERKLSDVTYEIERLKGSLRRWDNLVAFSTITIELREKLPADVAAANQPKTYSEKIVAAFIDSFIGTIRALGNLLIFIISMLPTLIILGIIYLLTRPIIKKILKHKNKKEEKL